jgi:TonB-dependent receptor
MRANNGLVRMAVLQALACASGLLLATPGRASADPARFDIAAQPMPNALKSFAAQAKMQLLYRYDIVSHATASPVTGQLEKHAALEQLLRGTGLEAVYSSENTATIRLISTGEKPAPGSKATTGDKPGPFNSPPTSSTAADRKLGYIRLAENDTGPQPTQSASSNQSSDQGPLAEVVVVGVKQAMATSQEIKMNASTFVDSITATDLGAFPDKSASDALMRLPGITVNRLQSNDDSTHPSGEPTNILIRGLTQVRTELNGRDAFSSDSGRGLNFNDISPELLSRADAYKNQTADMIEGGIAGTVDLRTRLPFDQEGHVLVGQVQGDYGDRSNQLTPAYSVLASDSLRTDVGRFGLLLDYARSHVITRTESVIMDKIDTYCSSGFGTANHAIVNPDGSIPCTSNPFGGKGWAFAPDGIRYSQVDYDRDRIGSTVAGQFENDSKSVLATVQYTDSGYHNKWLENASHAILDGSYFGTPAFDPRTTSILGPADGTGPLVFGSNGMLQSGTLTQPHGSWLGSNSPNLQDAINTGSAVPGVPFVNDCGPGFTCTTSRDGLYFQNEARDFNHTEDTKEISANLKWDISPRLHTNFDAQYIDARVVNHDIIVATGSMANYQYSTNGEATPQVQLLPGSNVNYAPGGLTNPHNYWIPFIQGHEENDGGIESAFRVDGQFDIDKGGWLDSLKAGVRYADRTQTVRYSTFNWTPIAANWNCNGPGFNADNTSPAPYPPCAGGHPDFKGYGAGIWGTTNFSPFYNGSVYPNGPLVFLNNATLSNFSRWTSALSGATTNSPIGGGYVPICSRPEATVDGCFTPSEVMRVEEQTEAAYLRLDFGGPNTNIFGHVNVVGNVGVRVVRTREISKGNVAFPSDSNLLSLARCTAPLGSNSVVNPGCYLTPDIIAFSSGGGLPNTFKGSHINALPSFNVRLGLDDKDFIRFAYSRALSRPDFGLLRNYIQMSAPVINTTPDSPYVVYNSPTAAHIPANVVGYKFVFDSTGGNAGLLPEIADQFDLSYERYYGSSSAFTVGLFYKKLSNSLSYDNFGRTFTNNGATETAQILGPINIKNGGNIKGVEAAYQTFFDFLPGLLNGLGVQANYTYVSESGIHNSNLINATSSGGVGAVGAGVPVVTGVVIDSHRLAGVSDHTFNIVGLYEKGPVGFRLAYNWRSSYLTSNLDCCIGLPVFQKAAGFLDGSIRYSIGSHVELSLDATNLLDTRIGYQQQIFGDSSATPGAAAVYRDSGWSRIDRRYQFGVRAKF